MKGKIDKTTPFSEFPAFTKLTLDDQDLYKNAISKLPPYSDWQFSTLQVWWDLEDSLQVSSLNGNLVIQFSLPYDQEEHCGYCLVGTNETDNSLKELFGFLQKEGLPAKLVHVPEFVTEQIENPKDFEVVEEDGYHDYILDSLALSKMEGTPFSALRLHKNRFNKETKNRQVKVRPLDLSTPESQNNVFETIMKWDAAHPPKNDPGHVEYNALIRALGLADTLGIQGLGLYVDEALHGVVLYEKTGNYYLVHHFRISYTVSGEYEFLMSELAKIAVERKVPYINVEMDLGLEGLRQKKKLQRPVAMFRKFTVKLRTNKRPKLGHSKSCV